MKRGRRSTGFRAEMSRARCGVCGGGSDAGTTVKMLQRPARIGNGAPKITGSGFDRTHPVLGARGWQGMANRASATAACRARRRRRRLLSSRESRFFLARQHRASLWSGPDSGTQARRRLHDLFAPALLPIALMASGDGR